MIGMSVMRSLKDKERLTLVAKVLCEVYGPLTSREILNFINNFKSISFCKQPNTRELSMLLTKNPSFVSKGEGVKKFEVREVHR